MKEKDRTIMDTKKTDIFMIVITISIGYHFHL